MFNCAPTTPPDGNEYLQVVHEVCDVGKPGGTQRKLIIPAIVGLVVYTVGYPALVALVLARNRELVMEDQLLRAKGVGNDRLTNPHAYEFRKRWGGLYYQFKPDAYFWIVLIVLRKFLIALVTVRAAAGLSSICASAFTAPVPFIDDSAATQRLASSTYTPRPRSLSPHHR